MGTSKEPKQATTRRSQGERVFTPCFALLVRQGIFSGASFALAIDIPVREWQDFTEPLEIHKQIRRLVREEAGRLG